MLPLQSCSRRSFIRWSTVAAAGILAGCAPAQPKEVEKIVKETVVVVQEKEKVVEVTPTAAPAGPVTIRILLWEQGEELNLYKKLMAHFTELEPNINIAVESPPGDFAVKLQTLIAAGMSPDIIRDGDNDFASYVVRGSMENLDPYVEKQADWDVKDFLQGVYNTFVYDGHLWSVADCPVGRGLFYNKTLFDKEGAPYPDDKWDWNTMLSVAQKLTKRNGTTTEQFGLNFSNWGECLETMVVQNGGNIVDEAMTKCLLREPASYEAIQWFADLTNKHKVSPLPQDITAGFTFQSGKVAMTHQEGSWMIAEFLKIRSQTPEFNWEYALLPKSPNGTGILVLNVAGFAMSPQSKYKDETWKFLNYMSREGSEYEATLGSGSYLPVRKSSLAKPGLYYRDDAGYNQKAVADQIDTGVSIRLKHKAGQEIWRAIGSGLDPVWLGTKPAKDACIAVADMVDFLLAG